MKNKINSRSLLSTLWIFILLNIIFRDLHEFLNQGHIEEMMNLNISEETMLFYGIVLEIPIMMIVLSKILNDVFNKWINIIVAGLLMIGTLSTLVSADLDDIFFTLINTIAFLAIAYIAWRLPLEKESDLFETF